MPNLTKQLKGRKPGQWVVLDRSMRRVLAAGSTRAIALRRARRTRKLATDELGVVVQVPDPRMVHVY